jgi:hypothetical protein
MKFENAFRSTAPFISKQFAPDAKIAVAGTMQK